MCHSLLDLIDSVFFFKWVIGICIAGLKVEILVKLHSTPCISQDETVICI